MLLDFSWSPLAKPLDSAVVWSGILSGIGGGFVEICRNHWSDIISCIRSKTMWRAMFLVACVSVGRCQLGFSHWLFPRAPSVFFLICSAWLSYNQLWAIYVGFTVFHVWRHGHFNLHTPFILSLYHVQLLILSNGYSHCIYICWNEEHCFANVCNTS